MGLDGMMARSVQSNKDEGNNQPHKVEILDCKPGHWETLAAPVTITGKKRELGDLKEDLKFTSVQDEEVIEIAAGMQINMLGGAGAPSGRVRIEVTDPAKGNDSNFNIYAPAFLLSGVTISAK